ncbi:unnamed protein product [Lactuca virosa]|uniref:Secreted protein n=1 Tax=Lactuca virosa TaxID=75947 RepID=A0AAU9LRV9_9ASTR|nr:unnamed protein product [Lactuca virosa]
MKCLLYILSIPKTFAATVKFPLFLICTRKSSPFLFCHSSFPSCLSSSPLRRLTPFSSNKVFDGMRKQEQVCVFVIIREI